MSNEEESATRVIVWKNLRLIVKESNTPKEEPANTQALMVLVHANEGK